MKNLKNFKIFESESLEKDILEDLTLWGMSGIWNNITKNLSISFKYPDRVDQNEIITINKVLKRLKPKSLIISNSDLQGDCLKYLILNDNLEEFYCENNELTLLPELPSSLKILYCAYNNLKSLPVLPDNIQELWCEGNKLPFYCDGGDGSYDDLNYYYKWKAKQKKK